MPERLAKGTEEVLNGLIIIIWKSQMGVNERSVGLIVINPKVSHSYVNSLWGQDQLNNVIKGLPVVQCIDSFGALSNMQVTMVMGASCQLHGDKVNLYYS